jgi:hypothetical protein
MAAPPAVEAQENVEGSHTGEFRSSPTNRRKTMLSNSRVRFRSDRMPSK